MKILVVRHGECDWLNLEQIKEMGHLGDPGLNPKGRIQVEKLAKTLKNSGITAIYSSPAKRTRDSAKILSKELRVKVTYLPSLNGAKLPKGENLTELVTKTSKGKFSGLFGSTWQEEWLKRWPGFGESPGGYQIRIRKAINEILERHSKEETVLVVGHEETVWAFLVYLRGVPFPKAIKHKVGYASVTEF